jgi:hypothetical protein
VLAPEVSNETATVVLAAIDRLVGDLADARPALGAIGDGLQALAEGLGVERVIVAVDDATLGRQVFCSGRVPLGDGGVGLFGPAGAWTEPACTIDAVVAQLLDRAIAVAISRAGAVRSEAAAIDLREPAALAPPTSLSATIAAATARALRHGWGFTLVLLRGGPGLTEALRPRLRAADTLVATSDRELALVLPDTAGDRVPDVLARLAGGGDLPPFSYGLACCPADSRDAVVLARIATERLADAVRVHSLS